MKTALPELLAHFNSNATTLSYLWKVRRSDGKLFGFTTCDHSITFDDLTGDGPITYLASTGFTNTAAEGKADLSVDNLEATFFLDSEVITEEDIRNNFWDDCQIQIRVVNWADLTQGAMIIKTGETGTITMKNGVATAEIRGLTNKLTTQIGDSYGPVCRAQLGSGTNNIDMYSTWLCMIDIVALRQNGTVGSVPGNASIVPAAGLAGAAGYFNDGFIQFTSGILNGQKFEIKSWDLTTLLLFLEMPALPLAGDLFLIEPGCSPFDFRLSGKVQQHRELPRRAIYPRPGCVLGCAVMPTRAEVVNQARGYLGSPFVHQGRLRGRAIDCVGLLLCVFEDLHCLDKNGVPLLKTDYRNYGPQPNGRFVFEFCMQRLNVKSTEPLPGDIHLVAHANRPGTPRVRDADRDAAFLHRHRASRGAHSRREVEAAHRRRV